MPSCLWLISRRGSGGSSASFATLFVVAGCLGNGDCGQDQAEFMCSLDSVLPFWLHLDDLRAQLVGGPRGFTQKGSGRAVWGWAHCRDHPWCGLMDWQLWQECPFFSHTCWHWDLPRCPSWGIQAVPVVFCPMEPADSPKFLKTPQSPCRLLQEQHQGGCEDHEGGQHGSWCLSGRGKPDEEAAAQQAGPAVRRGHQAAHLHRDRVHGQW